MITYFLICLFELLFVVLVMAEERATGESNSEPSLPARLRMRNSIVLETSAENRVKPFLKVKPESHIDSAKGYAVLWRPRIVTRLLMVSANSVPQHLVMS